MRHDPGGHRFGVAIALTMVAAATAAIAEDVAGGPRLELLGVTVTPHLALESMRYSRAPEPADGARVQLFLVRRDDGPAPVRVDGRLQTHFGGKSPAELLASRDWAWHDTPSATPEEALNLPSGGLIVWTFNGRTGRFGPSPQAIDGARPAENGERAGDQGASSRNRVPLVIGPAESPWFEGEFPIERPDVWISAVTFFADGDSILPTRLIVHLANESSRPATIQSVRLWTPDGDRGVTPLRPRAPLTALKLFDGSSTVPAGDRSGFEAVSGPIPRGFVALEVTLEHAGKPRTLWTHLKVKPERFDISGGWVGGAEHLREERFLKTLRRFHVNTAHLQAVPGYTDTPLYDRHPLRYFHDLRPLETFDTDAMLPRIHAVEFLGEPQYGGGRPVPPQEVWTKLRPFAGSRLPTSLTHSEERIWRDYAGLSDFPHYDAYRVCAPSPDAWGRYERWGGARVTWGAPLETIGDMCRSLRELNRPMPCAYWSQGPHHGWGMRGWRTRTSPTPAELRAQAWHAVSARITSLYWFNLSLKSLVKWRDTLDELTRVGRELRLVEEILLEGDAFEHRRLTGQAGRPDWDLASVIGPRAGLLVANDLAYQPDPNERVFRFGPARPARFRFRLPAHFGVPAELFRLDADGMHAVTWKPVAGGVEVEDRATLVAAYVVARAAGLKEKLELRRKELVRQEEELKFDPARNDADFKELEALLKRSQ